MRITILLIITFLCFQCSNSRKNDPNEQHLPANLVFYGNGESGIAGFYNEWTIKILDKNLVEMLCSMKEDSLDIRSMNRQYFGHIGLADSFNYKIIIDRALYIDDCDRDIRSDEDNEPLSINIDSALFKEVKYWDLKVKPLNGNDSIIRITNTYHSFFFKNLEPTMTLYPDKESGYYPISLRTGKRCAINIGSYHPHMDYYLNKVSDKFELVWDITPYVNMQNKKCDYCVKKMDLKIKK